MGKHIKTLINEKPHGATLYDKGFKWYMKRDEKGNLMAFIEDKWKSIRFCSGGKHMVVSLLEPNK